MLTLTPTEFTQLFTTVSRLFLSSPGVTSCWYWPTPMLFGSTFTSSASGSCRRRAMEMAPRMVRSSSGNSSRATSLALYTLAPASLTITTGTRAEPELAERAADERLGLAARRAVAHRHRRHVGALDRQAQDLLGGRALALRAEVDDVAAQVRARLAHDGELAARADAGVDAEHGPRAVRRGEEQLAQVLGEDVDRRGVGDLAQRLVHLVLDARLDVHAQRRGARRAS